MIYINNCKLLIINRCKDIKKYQLLNYSHCSHHSLPLKPPSFSPKNPPPLPPHPCPCNSPRPCGSHPLPARAARTPFRVSPSLSEFFFKKYFTHYQRIIKNFQKKLQKNLQDKKNAVPLHPQMRRIAALRKRKTTRTLT